MFLQLFQEKDMIRLAAAQQQDRFAFILPVSRIVRVGLDAVGIAAQGDCLRFLRLPYPRAGKRKYHQRKNRKVSVVNVAHHYKSITYYILNITNYFIRGQLPQGHRAIFEYIDRIVPKADQK